jgi:hypothetical protein
MLPLTAFKTVKKLMISFLRDLFLVVWGENFIFAVKFFLINLHAFNSSYHISNIFQRTVRVRLRGLAGRNGRMPS